jgi:histidine triad (HIT) family protein
VTMELTIDCVFCDIIAGVAPAKEFVDMESCVSFVPLNPVTPGHKLFVPKIHTESVADAWAAGDSLGAFVALCNWGMVKNEDFNVITSAGRHATQTIFHTHIHYVPRRKDDGLKLPWSE